MKPLHLAIMGIIMSLVVWGSLFFTVLNQSSRTNQLLRNDNKLLAQQKETLDTISANAKQRTMQINDLQNHIDCIVELFQQPNRTNLVISDLQNCHLTTTGVTSVPKALGVATPAPQPQISTQPVTQPSLSSPPSSSPPSPTPPTAKPGLVKQILKFLGL